MEDSSSANGELSQPKRVGHLFSQRSPGSIYLRSTLECLHFLLRLGVRPKGDGWRKYATAFLRTEDSRFLLTALRLKTPHTVPVDDAHIDTKYWIIERLARFFTAHPRLWNRRLEWRRNGATIQPNEHLDLVWAHFDGRGGLSEIGAFFDADTQLSLQGPSYPYAEFFIRAYNKTLLAGRQRPYHLLTAVRDLCRNRPDGDAAIEFAQRVLDSIFIHFESIPVDGRLAFPDFSVFPHPGGGAFNILCRFQSPGYQEADLWFHINHALLDGNPVLEAIDDLRGMWGTSGPTVLPQASHAFTLVQPAHNDSGRELVYAYQCLSFEHLLNERQRLAQKYAHLLKDRLTIAGMIVWGLSNQSTLGNLKLTIVVDVPEDLDTDEPRSLGFITSRPNAFLDEGDRELSFVRFQRYINDAIESVRTRQDMTYLTLKGQALMPTTSYEMTLSLVPQAVRDIGGSISLTIMPLAGVCAPPADDTKDAVIAVGNFATPTEDGKLAGFVCVKCAKRDLDQYWDAVHNTITRWST